MKSLLKIGWVSQLVLVVKNLPADGGDRRDTGSIPGLGRSPEGGHGNPVQYSCLENPMDRGARETTDHSHKELDMTDACTHAHHLKEVQFSSVTQSCPTLCDPIDSIAHQSPLSMGILQARILEWVAMPSSRGSSQPRD